MKLVQQKCLWRSKCPGEEEFPKDKFVVTTAGRIPKHLDTFAIDFWQSRQIAAIF
jgi:hypothetical protein